MYVPRVRLSSRIAYAFDNIRLLASYAAHRVYCTTFFQNCKRFGKKKIGISRIRTVFFAEQGIGARDDQKKSEQDSQNTRRECMGDISARDHTTQSCRNKQQKQLSSAAKLAQMQWQCRKRSKNEKEQI